MYRTKNRSVDSPRAVFVFTGEGGKDSVCRLEQVRTTLGYLVFLSLDADKG